MLGFVFSIQPMRMGDCTFCSQLSYEKSKYRRSSSTNPSSHTTTILGIVSAFRSAFDVFVYANLSMTILVQFDCFSLSPFLLAYVYLSVIFLAMILDAEAQEHQL